MNRKPLVASPLPSPVRPPRRPLLTSQQAADFLGVALKFMTRYREHKNPHVHVGKFVRFPPEELEDWVRVGEDAYAFACRRCHAPSSGAA